MSDTKISSNSLFDLLQRKKECLLRINKLCIEQETILNLGEFSNASMARIINNKQIQIDKIRILDDGFKTEFDNFKNVLVNDLDLYNKEIEKLQELNKEIGDLAKSIEELEQKNKARFELVSTTVKDRVKNFKKNKKATTNYYSTMRKQGGTEGSYFFDSKK